MQLNIRSTSSYLLGFLGGGSAVKNLSVMQEVCRICRFNPWVWKIPWSRKWQPTAVFLPGKSQGQRSLVGYSPWDYKEWEMTEHISILSMLLLLLFSCPVVSDSLRPHGLQHARSHCPSPSPEVCPSSCPLHW